MSQDATDFMENFTTTAATLPIMWVLYILVHVSDQRTYFDITVLDPTFVWQLVFDELARWLQSEEVVVW